eukprot:TRINITY_DN3503_c1_g1_i1.p1 TRINITY_DN3503_c1_g1~~TRINITY_DN3503_c1_g1_i1.p1  ORF type:complete len:210 (-),score=42.47 TRINITY_DN3503_c1_g1_i1:395-1024(-)
MTDEHFGLFLEDFVGRILTTSGASFSHKSSSQCGYEHKSHDLIREAAKGVGASLTRFLGDAWRYDVIAEEEVVQALVLLNRIDLDPIDLEVGLGRRDGLVVFMGLVMIASKMHQDQPFNNGSFAQLMNCTLAEVNSLERALLNLLSFNATVSAQDFHYMRHALLSAYDLWICSRNSAKSAKRTPPTKSPTQPRNAYPSQQQADDTCLQG